MVKCPSCRTELEVGKFEPNDAMVGCPDCGQAFRLGDARNVKVLKKRRNPANDAAAMFISLVVPGSGHLIKNRPADGLVYFLSAMACIIVAAMMGQALIVGAFGAAMVGIMSAISSARA